MNHVLSTIPQEERDFILSAGALVRMESGTVIRKKGPRLAPVYFIMSGVVALSLGDGLAFALVGRESVAGASCILRPSGVDYDATVVVEGDALTVSPEVLQDERRLPGLRDALNQEVYRRLLQAASAARDAGRHQLEQRLARLLCLILDRCDGDTFNVTHDMLATWLGVRRPGITVALHLLEGNHLIRSSRGRLQVLDRSGLERASGGAFREEDRLNPTRVERAWPC